MEPYALTKNIFRRVLRYLEVYLFLAKMAGLLNPKSLGKKQILLFFGNVSPRRITHAMGFFIPYGPVVAFFLRISFSGGGGKDVKLAPELRNLKKGKSYTCSPSNVAREHFLNTPAVRSR